MTKKSWPDFRAHLNRLAEEQGVPIGGVFELTARCNLQCKMCYICKQASDTAVKQQELTADEWLFLAKEARDAGMLYILLTGGEVFLRPDFRQIYDGIVQLGLIPTIYSNASLITPKIIDWLRQSPPEKLEVTLYGASAETYHRVCGDAGAFEKVIKNIDALLEAGIQLRLRTTVIEENKGDYDALKEISYSRGIPLRFSFYISPSRVDSGCLDSPVSSRLPPVEISDYMRRASKDYRRQLGRSETDPGENSLADETKSQEGERLSPFRCTAGKSDLWMTWQGYMAGCGLIPELHTKPLEIGFRQAWSDLGKIMEEVPKCQTCLDCSLKDMCISCPARLKLETGHYDKPAEYLCAFAKRQSEYYG